MARSDALILGGSHEIGVDTPLPTRVVFEAIWQAHLAWVAAGAANLPVPVLRETDILAVSAGIRPFRPNGVRLEKELLEDMPVIHNYGHGGCGISLAWGCAAEVMALISAL